MMQQLQHYKSPVTINIPLQIALVRQGLDCIVMGGVDGTVHIYDCSTGTLVHQLEHSVKGHIQVVSVSTLKHRMSFNK